MTDFRKLAFVGLVSLGLATVGSVGCSSSSTTGTGGSTGTGGAHTGGSTGTGGSGTAGTGAVVCGTGTTTPPTAALITDFSDAAAPDGGTSKLTFGTATTVQGGVSTFQNPASTPGTVSLSSGALAYTATVSAAGTGADAYPYSGFVVYINGPACVDASQYTGVSFSISGNLGTCGLVFSFNDAEHGVTADDPRFIGPSGSYAPQDNIASMVSATAATVQVPFTGPSGGSPASAPDPANITGVQWQLSNSNTATAACTGSITVDNVTFYK
jgi:hypothetical protein